MHPQPKTSATVQEAAREVLSLPASDSLDVLSAVLRKGAQRMLAQAIEAEVESHLGERSGLTVLIEADVAWQTEKRYLPQITPQTAC